MLLIQMFLLTYKVPFSIGYITCDVSLDHLQVQRPASVRPRAELQVTSLNIEGKPPYIDVTRALKDTCEHERKVTGEKKTLIQQPDTKVNHRCYEHHLKAEPKGCHQLSIDLYS